MPKKDISDLLIDELGRHSRDISNIEKDISRIERDLEAKRTRIQALRESKDSIELTLSAMDTDEFTALKKGFIEAKMSKLDRAERQVGRDEKAKNDTQ